MDELHVVRYISTNDRRYEGVVLRTLHKGKTLIVESDEEGIVLVHSKNVIERMVNNDSV